MHWQYTHYVLPLVITAAISATIALVIWRRRHVPGAVPLSLLMLAVVEWSLGNVFELVSTELSAKLFWANVEYLGIVIVPVMWLAFSLQYTGREKWLTSRNLTLFAIVPLITLLLVWTNNLHGLMRYNIRLDTSGPFSVVAKTYGKWFWVHTAYSYGSLFLGTLVLLQVLFRPPRLYRRQAIALLIGALAPWVGNALYISGLSPIAHLDVTPCSFTISGLAAAWGLFRFRLLDIVPVARDVLIERMVDGAVVLDAQNRVVDLNPAAERIIGHTALEAIGQSGTRVLSCLPDFVEGYRHARESQREITLGEGEARRYYSLLISPLHEEGGHLVVLREITGLKRAEEKLKQYQEHLEDLVEERSAKLGETLKDLRKEITQRQRAKDQIKASLKEKEVLLREIHHRVKNNLQIISSLLNLQSRYIKDKQVLHVFKESQDRIKSMALIHKKLYQSKDLARIDFAEYVRSLIADLFRSYKADYDLITLKTNIDDVFLGIDTAIPCGLIINELVSNSLKYAFPEDRQGEIRIDLHSEKEGKFTLIVSDSGVGFPKDLDFRNTESLGLQLICTLVDQLQGTIGLDRTGGTEFKIAFTEPKDKQGG